MRVSFAPIALLLLAGCGSGRPGRVVTPDTISSGPPWTAEDLAKPISVRPAGGGPGHSAAFIRLAASEKPHIHRDHDLTVTLLSGVCRLHLGDAVHLIRTGDVVIIPRGTPHWAEYTGGEPPVAYAVFVPPYDGTDTHPLEP